MRLNDTLTGLLILAFGLAVAAYARTFPPMPGQPVGPSLFPTLIGLVLAMLGAGLAAAGLRHRGARPVEIDDWVRRPRIVINFLSVVAALVFYAVAVDRLGFFITGFAFLSVLMLTFGVRRVWIAPLAAAVTLAMHYAFYTLLRVPLPWGLLENLAW